MKRPIRRLRLRTTLAKARDLGQRVYLVLYACYHILRETI